MLVSFMTFVFIKNIEELNIPFLSTSRKQTVLKNANISKIGTARLGHSKRRLSKRTHATFGSRGLLKLPEDTRGHPE